MFFRRLAPWIVGCGLILTSPTDFLSVAEARADTPAGAPTKEEARTLFQEALAHVAAQDFATALGKLERVAAFKRTPQVGFYIGRCHENLGKMVMALGEYRIALGDAKAADMEDVIAEATEAIAQLEPRIPRLNLVRGAGASAATISVDAKMVGESAVGKPMPMDPGTRIVVATALGFEPFRQEVTLAEGKTVTVEVTLSERVQEDTTQSTKGSSSDTPIIVGWTAMGIGAVGLGTSAVFFGLKSKDKKDSNSEKQHGKIGFVALGVGGVGVATGAVMFIVARGSRSRPVQQPPQPSVSLRLGTPEGEWAGLTLDGKF